jgi:hypothetical protein
MKSKLNILLLLVLFSTGVAAAPRTLITVIVNGGNWSSTSTWSLGRIPANNDSIVIPAGYTVILDNSYTLNNVYINIAGTLNFNQNNTLALDVNSVVNIQSGGTLTATHPTPNELLTINGVTKYDGKTDGSIPGPVQANVMTGSSPSGFSEVILPVNFVSFTAIRGDGTVQLNWNTTGEINNSHFEVERSADGSAWQTIGNVAPGTSSLANSYTYTDEAAPVAQTEYRIRQVDFNGNSLYSSVVVVGAAANSTARAKIFANGKTVSIFPENISGSRITVRVITMGGQVLQQETVEAASGRIDLSVSTASTGIYVVQVTDGSQWALAKKVML